MERDQQAQEEGGANDSDSDDGNNNNHHHIGLNIKDKLAFGFYTSLNLIKENVLIRITFQGKIILKLYSVIMT